MKLFWIIFAILAPAIVFGSVMGAGIIMETDFFQTNLGSIIETEEAKGTTNEVIGYTLIFIFTLLLIILTDVQFSELGFNLSPIYIIIGIIVFAAEWGLWWKFALPIGIKQGVLIEALLMLLFVAPVEEIYRFFLFLKIEKEYGVVLGFILSAVSFGVMHIFVGIGSVIHATIAGIFYNAVFLISGRKCVPAIVAHALWNIYLTIFVLPV